MESSITLVDFLIEILQTQARTLQRLAAFFGEDEFLQILEDSDESESGSHKVHRFSVSDYFTLPSKTSHPSCYTRLEGAVRDMHLPAVLEFHLWAYPFYRSIIEGSVDFNAGMPLQSSPSLLNPLVNACVTQAQEWVKKLPIHPELSEQAERTALIPWLRFRTEFLKKMGRSPFVSI